MRSFHRVPSTVLCTGKPPRVNQLSSDSGSAAPRDGLKEVVLPFPAICWALIG